MIFSLFKIFGVFVHWFYEIPNAWRWTVIRFLARCLWNIDEIKNALKFTSREKRAILMHESPNDAYHQRYIFQKKNDIFPIKSSFLNVVRLWKKTTIFFYTNIQAKNQCFKLATISVRKALRPMMATESSIKMFQAKMKMSMNLLCVSKQ